MVELLPALFQGPPFFGCYLFFWPLSFFLFCLSVSSASSNRLWPKNPIFIGFFVHTLLKRLVISCSNNELNLNCPKKRCTFFLGETRFLTIFFSKTLILHHPLKTVHEKISQNPYFYRLKKAGQVIDPTPARLLTLLWPKSGQVIDPTAYIYIYIYIYMLESYFLYHVWPLES